MPYRCSCGYENTNGKKFAGHLGRYSKFGHRKIGWVDETGEVLDSRPGGGSKPQGKQAAPEVLVVSQGQAPPEEVPLSCLSPPPKGSICSVRLRLEKGQVIVMSSLVWGCGERQGH